MGKCHDEDIDEKNSMKEVTDLTVGTHSFAALQEGTDKMFHPYDTTLEILDYKLCLAPTEGLAASSWRMMGASWGVAYRLAI